MQRTLLKSKIHRATVTGDIEDVDGVLKITRIHVSYHLKAPEGQHADADQHHDQRVHHGAEDLRAQP